MKTPRLLLPALVLSALAVPAAAAIRPCATPITLSPPTLTAGTTGLAYSQTLTAAGGTAFTFSTTQGVLPPGLAFANPTATTVDIAGSPTTPGTFVFTITARNTPNGCSGGRMFALFVNDRTVVTTTAGTTVFVEDGGPVVVDAGLTVSDSDSPNLASATVTITNPQNGAAEVLAATACAGLTVTPGPNTLGIAGSQPPSAYQTCLRSVTYDNGSQNRGTTPRVLSFVANDGTAPSAAANKTVSVAGSDDPPVADPISPAAFDEDTAAVVTLSYTDPDGDQATACAVTGPTNVTVSTPCACSTGVCTVGVTGSPLHYNGPASFSYTVTANAQTSNSAAATLTIAAVDDAPVATAIAPAAFNEDTQSTVTLSYTDVESDLATACAVTAPTNVTVSTPCACTTGVCTVGVTGSPLNYNGVASFSYTVTANAQTSNSATASLTITPVDDPPVANAISPPAFNEDTASTITLSYTDVENDLATACAVTGPTNVTVSTPCACTTGVCTVGVTGSPLHHNGSASFSYTVTAAAQTSNSATASLTITPVADPPVANAITPPAFDEDVAATITLSYTDPDGDQATACAVTSPTNVTVSTACACTTGVCTVGVTGTPLNQNGAASFSYTVTAGAQTSNNATATLTITAVNDAPVLGGVAGGFTYTENDAATAIAPALTVTDVDNTTLSSATITVSANFQSGQDVLSFTNGAGMGNVAGSFAGNVLTLTSAGSTATTTQWQTALRAVRYNNSSDDPNTSVRTVTFQVNDGAAANNLSNQVSGTITLTAVNDAPTANGFTNQPAQAGIPIIYPAGKLGGTDLEAGTTITIDLTPINVTNGRVSLRADGGFTFTPLPWVTTGSFQYRVSDNGSPAPGANSAYVTVSFTVAGPAIYFVKSAGAGFGDCTLGSECTFPQALFLIGSLTNARIFISDANTYASAVTLNSGGWLTSQGVTGTTFDALFGIVAPAQGVLVNRPSLGGGRPTITNTVTLNTNSAVRGINISTTTATGVTDPAGAITGALVSEVAVTTTTGTGVNFSNTAGTFGFDGLTTTGGAGASLTGANSGGTFTFSNVVVSSGANAAFLTTGGGTVAVTGAANTLTSTTGTALNVSNTTIGSNHVTFRSVSAGTGAGSAGVGITVDTTGSLGGLRVTGLDGPDGDTNPDAGSGGTIQHKTGADGSTTNGIGIFLNNTTDVRLAGMQLNDFDNYAIRGNLVTGFRFTDSRITGVNGTNVATPFNEGGISFIGTPTTGFGVSGSVAILDNEITGGRQRNVSIDNATGTMNINFLRNNVHHTQPSPNGDDGFAIEVDTSAVMFANISNNTFTAHGGDHFNLSLINNANADLTFSNNTLRGGFAGALGQGLFILGASYNGTFKYDISGNSVQGNVQGAAIFVNKGSGTATYSGRIVNNVVGDAAIVGSGSAQAQGMHASARGAGGSHRTLIDNNQVYQYFDRGIVLEAGEGSPTFVATVTSNTVSNFADATNSLHGIHFDLGILGTDNAQITIDVRNNLIASAGNEPQGGADFRMRTAASNDTFIAGYSGGNSSANAQAFVDAQNPAGTTFSVTQAATGTYNNGPAVPLPPPNLPMLPPAP